MIKYNQNTKGAAMLLFIIFFLFASVSITYLMSRSIYADLVTHRVFVDSKLSYMTAIAANEDIAYRYVGNIVPDATEVMTLSGAIATTTTVYDGVADSYTVSSRVEMNGAVRTSQIDLQVSNGVSFNYGMQSGQGGIIMNNSSAIRGNVYSNGSVVANSSNWIYGDIITAGPGGLVDGVVATGTVWSHTIDDSSILQDAYYQTISNTSVSGTLYASSSDMATATFPISDDIILGWEAEAEAGGTYSGACPYVIQSDISIGPLKIPCDFTIKKNNTDVTLLGPIWVEGDFSTENGPTILIDSAQPDTLIPIIADDQGDRVTSSKVSLNQSSTFVGAAGSSHVLVISMNNDDEENGGSEVAITGGQSGNGDLVLYAPHGRAVLGNNGSLTELTAYTIELYNSVEVIFDSGLSNPNFTGSPSAGFVINSWKEVD